MQSPAVGQPGDDPPPATESTLEKLLTAANRHQAAWRLEQALDAYRRCLAAAPEDVRALNNMAVTLQHLDRYGEAIELLERLHHDHPRSVEFLANLAHSLKQERRLTESRRALVRAMALAPGDGGLHFAVALLLLLIGDLPAGFAVYERRDNKQALRRNARQWRFKDVWDGRVVAGKRYLLAAEQGLGDFLQFVRYAQAFAENGASVRVDCHGELRRLMRTTEWVADIGARAFDRVELAMSMPHRLGTTGNTIPNRVPYIRPPADGPVLPPDDRLTVGLVHAGNPNYPRGERRHCPVAALAPLLRVDGCRFVSLMIGRHNDRLAASPEGAAVLTVPIGDFADTARIAAQTDLVISIDTSTAHLAGAMAIPVWILLHYACDWRFGLDDGGTPWYPTARLFRQQRPGDWDGVIATVTRHLTAVVDRRREMARWEPAEPLRGGPESAAA